VSEAAEKWRREREREKTAAAAAVAAADTKYISLP
jgi:hypothetical protein